MSMAWQVQAIVALILFELKYLVIRMLVTEVENILLV
jgi:hypothetical protein